MTAAEFLARFQRVRKNHDGDWHVPCQSHDDSVSRPEKFSLHITEKSDRLLVYCMAGCSHEAVMRSLGLTDAQLFFEVPGTNGRAIIGSSAPAQRATLAAFAAKKHLEVADLEAAGWRDSPSGIAIPYLNRDGSPSRMRYRSILEPGQGFKWDTQKDIP